MYKTDVNKNVYYWESFALCGFTKSVHDYRTCETMAHNGKD